MGSDVQGDGPPDDILTHSRDFWAARAEVLHQLFPDVEPLELILFTASSTNVVLMGARMQSEVAGARGIAQHLHDNLLSEVQPRPHSEPDNLLAQNHM